jgi:hypothetical protein
VILPNGSIEPWLGGTGLGAPVAMVNPDVWVDPNLLLEAGLNLSAAATNQLSALSQTYGFHFGGSYYLNFLNQGFNEKWFQDGQNTWYYIKTDGSIYQGDGTLITQVVPQVWDDPSVLFEAKLSASAQAQLSALQQQYGFQFVGDYYQAYNGLNAKWFQDRQGFQYALRTDGRLQLWNGVVGGVDQFTDVATVDPMVWTDPYLLFMAPNSLNP